MRKEKNLFYWLIGLLTVILCMEIFADIRTEVLAANSDSSKKTYDIYERAGSFLHASGAGAWQVSFELNPDGSFSGAYHDLNMGETGKGYPDGTLYLCGFSGKLSAPEKINEWEYSAKIQWVKTEVKPGKTKHKRGTKYVYTEAPDSLKKGKEIRIYIPGTETAKLPKQFMEWAGLCSAWSYEPTTLPFYGLYFPATGSGYVGSVTEKEAGKIALKNIGKGYSVVTVDWESYRIKKENYIFIKEKNYGDSYQFRVEDLKRKELFSIEDRVSDVLLGKKDVYFAVDGENYRGLVKLNIKSKKAVPVPDTDDTAGFGRSFYDKKSGEYKTKYFSKDWLYLQLMEGDSDPGICMLNLKTGKVMYAPEYFIKGKVLYYGVVEKNDYNSIKLYKSNLDFTNSKYIGKYEKDWSKGQLLGINKVDNNYVYYHTLKHEGMSSKEITVKFKIKK